MGQLALIAVMNMEPVFSCKVCAFNCMHCYRAQMAANFDFRLSGTVGDNSCEGYLACYQAPAAYSVFGGTKSFDIGDNSCHGEYSCAESANDEGTITIGHNSCNDFSSCLSVYTSVGNGSCNAACACIERDGFIGDNVFNDANYTSSKCPNFDTSMPTTSETPVPTPSKSPSSMPPSPTRVGSGLWVPNAFVEDGDSDKCLLDNDGEFNLPAATPLYATKEECCVGFYAWNFNECIGNTPTFKFYPNWLRVGSSLDVCLFDDGSNEVPPGTPTYDSPQECCAAHYSWNLDVCNSVEPGPTYKYFPNWNGNDHVCLKDDGTNVAPESVPLYEDLASCCDFNYSWNLAQCYAVEGPSGKYFPNLDGDDLTCFQNIGEIQTLPFGAPLYEDISSCCDHHYSWVSNECVNFLL